MSTVTKSVDVNVPIRAAYDQWTQFEEFPRFMEGVKDVRQLDDTHLHWKAEIAGVTKEWDAEITEQHPDERVAWKSTSGAPNAGVVTFHRLDDDHTRVTLQMDVEPHFGHAALVAGGFGPMSMNRSVLAIIPARRALVRPQRERGGAQESVRTPAV